MKISPRGKERYLLAFLLGFLPLAVTLLPLVLYDKGYFIYYGDFVSQQLPFYAHANEVVRSGGLLGWDWGTDLGSSFLGSYAFYLAGSPFFWLTVLLPQDWVLYAIPWLLCLKHGIASLTAYGYIRRFVSSRSAALTGGMLYAYSGFQLFNIFFNHFQDVTAFFPLMLIAMEELINNKRRGVFALSVALMAIINYFFFTGQCVFLILYFFIRLRSGDFRADFRKFLALAMEAVLGVCIAGVVLLPAVMAILANERVSEMLFGQNMVLYNDKTRLIRIIQSFFMIPDAPARPNLFQTESGKWASIGGYLPLFSMAGVIAFLGQKRRHWASVMVWVCIVCAFVPVLNSAFYMLNGAYYARWYYMPILLMAMMTAYTLDNREIRWKSGVTATLVMPLVFGLTALLPTKDEDGTIQFLQFARIYPYFWVVLGVVLLFWLGLFWVYCQRTNGKSFQKLAVFLTAFACMGSTMTMVYFGKYISKDSKAYQKEAIHGGEHISVSYQTDPDDYFRVDVSKDYDNYPMFWGLSSMRCFQSVVNPSIMEFYDSIGITRDVASRAEPEYYTLRGLFSVKYYFEKIQEDAEPLEMPGFTLEREENGFRIYQNQAYIPMGFTYDEYVTNEQLEEKTDIAKERILIRSLVLDTEQAELYADILHQTDTNKLSLSEQEYLAACERHQAECCRNFAYDAEGFSAEITLEQPKLVFFSVPYESGWTAAVNGVPVTVEKVSNGFVAVRCAAGENQIQFSYEVPGLRYGFLLTVSGLLLLILYLILSKPLFKGGMRHVHFYDYQPVSAVRAAESYVQSIREQEQERSSDHGNGTSEGNKT